jgi:hypothetical protein
MTERNTTTEHPSHPIPDLHKTGMRLGNTFTIKDLARMVENDRQKLVAIREKKTSGARTMNTLLLPVLIWSMYSILSEDKLSSMTASMSWEQTAVRLVFLLSLVAVLLSCKFILRWITLEEEDLDVHAKCIIETIKVTHPEEVQTKGKKRSKNPDDFIGRFELPNKNITAKFLLNLNACFQRETGKDMPYRVYRFRFEELWNRALFTKHPKSELDDWTKEYADLVSLEELKSLAHS